MPAMTDVDTGKILSLRYQNRLSWEDIAGLVGMSPAGVLQRVERYRDIFESAANVEAFEINESKLLAAGRLKLLAHAFKDEVIEKMSGYQAIGSYGLIFDKQRLLDGKSTGNLAILSRMIDNTQDSGDKALRKLSLDGTQLHNSNPPQSVVSHNSYTPSEVIDKTSD